MSRRSLVIVSLVVMAAGMPLRAQSPDHKVEVTPFIGYRVGGDLSSVEGASHADVAEGGCYGIMIDFRVDEGGFVELRYSLQRTELDATGTPLGPGQVKVTDLDVEHYFIGGTYEWETDTLALPFVSADLGGVRFDAPGFNAETRFGFSLGGGVKLPVAKRINLRFDGRWVSSFLSGNTSFYCNSTGFCLVAAEGTYFGQFELTGGITFKF